MSGFDPASRELNREAQCLSRAQPKLKAFTFTLSAQNRDPEGTFRVTIPDDVRHCVSLEVAAFETQAVEQNISADENKVVWTEGLRLSTGEAPTVYGASDGSAGVPVFDHEICIRETLADGATHRYYKVGLCPQLNEVSTQIWDNDGGPAARVPASVTTHLLVTPGNAAKYFFSTTRNTGTDGHWAAPHYFEALQELVAAGQLGDVRAYTACMAQLRHIDLTVSGEPFVFRAPSAAASEGAPPAYGGTQFQVASDDKARAYLANLTAQSSSAGSEEVSTSAVAHGFLCCSPWHFPDIVTMLNHQLKTVTDSTTGGAGGGAAKTNYARCGTTGARPSNSYEFQYAEGRFRLLCRHKVLDFVVLENVRGTAGVAGYRDLFHGNGTAYGGAAQTVTRAALPTAPTGSSPRVTSLWRALGFRGTAPGTFTRETTRGGGVAGSVVTESLYGLRADQPPGCVLEAALQPAYYTPQTFADALSSALNGGRPKAAPSSPLQFASACAFVDSLGVTHALLLPAGYRTPHQYAAGLEFLLNRTDTRGALYSGHRHGYDETYAQWVPNGRKDGGSQVAGLAAAKTRLWYTCAYDAATGKFSLTNRELDGSPGLSLGNPAPATTFPATVGAAALNFASGTAVSGGIRARFTLSFRASDVPSSASAQLTATPSGQSVTAAFAAIFGFDAERWYEGSAIASTRASSCFPAYAQTLTRGQLNDVKTDDDALCLRPLDDAVHSDGAQHHNAVDFRGSGPDDRVGPRYCYAVTGSAQNDKQLTLHATHPAAPFSVDNAAVKSGDDTGTPNAHAYNNNVATVTVAVTNRQVTSFTVTANTVDTRQGSVHVITGATLANEAIFRVATPGPGGTIATHELMFGGSGTGTNPYVNTSIYGAYQLNATQDLRVIHGTACAYADTPIGSTTQDASRILVQAAAVREALPAATSVNGADWRSFQQALPFAPGDLVLLGLQQSVLLGSVNHGLLGGGAGGSHYLTVSQVSADGHLIAAAAVKANPSSAIAVGHHYIVQQGNCKTVIRVLTVDTASYTFAVVQRGVGHEIVSSKDVWLFGPIVPYMVGLVEEVGQTCLRRRTAAQTEPESEFTSQWASLYTDPGGSGAVVTTVTSLARDGSVLKIRLPLLAQYRQYDNGTDLNRYCHPSNLLRISPLELPRFQLLNAGPSVTRDFGRDDTAWPSAGLLGDSEVGAGTVKLPSEWDLDASAGILIALEDPDLAERNHVFAGPGGLVNNVVAQVPFGARVARSWASVHSKRFSLSPKHLRTVGLQLLDYKGNLYDLRGRSCRITLNVHYV